MEGNAMTRTKKDRPNPKDVNSYNSMEAQNHRLRLRILEKHLGEAYYNTGELHDVLIKLNEATENLLHIKNEFEKCQKRISIICNKIKNEIKKHRGDLHEWEYIP